MTPIQSIARAPGRAIDRLDSYFGYGAGQSPERQSFLGYALVAPAMAILGVFGLYPLGFAVYMSFFEWRGRERTPVGWANYSDALTNADFWNSLSVTVYFALGTVPLTLVLSFVIARLLFQIQRLRGFFRTIYFLPFVTSIVAAAMVWRTLLDPGSGPVTLILQSMGFAPQQWLLEPRGILHLITGGKIAPAVGPSLALCCVMAFEIWRASGFMIVIFLAGLSAIPRELEEAARIDGAGPLRTALHVTLPLLAPTVLFLSIVGVIGAFQAFNSFYALTGDGRGPLDTTQNLVVYIYSNFYEYGRLGYGAAVAALLCAMLVALTLAQWRLLGRKVYYR